jgi:hypothetical protein
VWGRTVEAFVGEEAHFVFNSFGDREPDFTDSCSGIPFATLLSY